MILDMDITQNIKERKKEITILDYYYYNLYLK